MPDPVKRGRYWHYDITVDGKRQRGSTGQSDKKLAKAVIAQTTERLNRIAVYGAVEELLFKEAARLYLAKNPANEKQVNLLVKHWGHRRVATIKAGEVTDLAFIIYPQAKPATRNRNVVAMVSVIINHAAKRGLANFIRLELFAITAAPKGAGSFEWLAAFQHAALARGKPHIAAIARFMFETGARIGQTCDLEWDALDLANGQATMRTRKTGASGAEFSYRTAWLTPACVAEIANLPKVHPRKVFGYATRDSPTKLWDKIVREDGLPKLSRHEAGRHGFFTETIVRNNMDPVTACKLGGSKSPSLVMKTYVHTENERDKAMAIFARKS